MATITMPTDLAYAEASFGQMRFDLFEGSETSGSQAVRLFGPPRWTLEIRSPDMMGMAAAGKWEAIVFGLRGRVNYVAAYDPGRIAPAGTMRGTMRLRDAVAAGATSMTIIGGTNGTLVPGDLLQISSGLSFSQTVKVVADAVSVPPTSSAFAWDNSGVFSWTNGGAFTWSDTGYVTVSFEPPLRSGYVPETQVAWDRPIIYCRSQAANASAKYPAGYVQTEGGYSLSLVEAFA